MFGFIKKKNNIVLKNSAVTMVDGIVSAIDNSINGGIPLLAIAWGLSKGLYGANIQLRQDRALEFVEMIRDNPGVFTKDILETPEFQDGFVYAFQKYLSERAEEKRKIVKTFFIGFAEAENKKDFKLERFLYTLELLSIEEIEVVKTFSDGTINKWVLDQFPEMKNSEVIKMASNPLNIKQIGDLILNKMKGMDKFANNDYTLETLSRLSSLGLVLGGTETSYDYSSSNFRASQFGKEFISYVLK